MKLVRVCASIAAVTLCIGLAACAPEADTTDGGTSPSASSSSRATPNPEASTSSPDPSDSATAPDAGAPSDPADAPVAKVSRPGQPDAPTQTAAAASPSDPVTYPDGVSVRIIDVSYAEETARGPGSFPGREFARLSFALSNDSADAIDLGTSVLTLLDDAGTAIPPVYADEADVHDFSGTLAPGKTATAVYAFAIPQGSGVTVVVDFDGTHTSAVFRGSLG